MLFNSQVFKKNSPSYRPSKYQSGFTLIETVIGIVVLAISFTVISTLFFPAVEQSADQIHQIRAAELGQSLLNEIQAKAFDDNSDKVGGINRCGENGVDCSSAMGAEGSESRATYDDVDDYNDINFGSPIEDSLGDSSLLSDLYSSYSVNVEVCNDSDFDGSCLTNANNTTAKLITVTVKTPTGFEISFSTYRVNF